MVQQQELRREIAVLESLHTSQFDRIAKDIEMLSSTDCAIKKRLENIENQKELRLRWQCWKQKARHLRTEEKQGRKWSNLSKWLLNNGN